MSAPMGLPVSQINKPNNRNLLRKNTFSTRHLPHILS